MKNDIPNHLYNGNYQHSLIDYMDINNNIIMIIIIIIITSFLIITLVLFLNHQLRYRQQILFH